MPVHTLDVLSRQLQPGQRALLRAFAIYCEAVPLETIRAVVAGGHKGGRDRLDALLSVLLNLHLLHGDVPVSIRPWPALYGRKAGHRLRLICTLRITTRSNSTPLTLGRETRRIG